MKRRQTHILEDVVFETGAGTPPRERRHSPEVAPPGSPAAPRHHFHEGARRSHPSAQIPPPENCAHCGGKHLKSFCPHIECHSCGGFGHICYYCPSNPQRQEYIKALRERRQQIDQGVPESELPMPARPFITRSHALGRFGRVLNRAGNGYAADRDWERSVSPILRITDGETASHIPTRSPPPYRRPRPQRDPPLGSRPKKRKMDGCTLYAGNLAPSVDVQVLRRFFMEFEVVDVRITREGDDMGHLAKIVGFVDFASPEEAERAYNDRVYTSLHGRCLALRFDGDDRGRELSRLTSVCEKVQMLLEECEELGSDPHGDPARLDHLAKRGEALDRRMRELTVDMKGLSNGAASSSSSLRARHAAERPWPAPGREQSSFGRGFRPPTPRHPHELIRPFRTNGNRRAPLPPPGSVPFPPSAIQTEDRLHLDDLRDSLRPLATTDDLERLQHLLLEGMRPRLEEALFALPRLGLLEGDARTFWRLPDRHGGFGLGSLDPSGWLAEFLQVFTDTFDPSVSLGVAQRPACTLPFQPGDWLVVVLRGRCTLKMANAQAWLEAGDAAWLPFQARQQEDVQVAGEGAFLHLFKPRPPDVA